MKEKRQRRVKRDEVRRRLLDAGYDVFVSLGYEGASLERVADAAGFSKGAVYSNFANKDELFFELIAARIEERIEKVRAAVASRTAGRRGAGGTDGARAAMEAGGFLAGQTLRGLGAADPGWQMIFIEFWLRCARNSELQEKLAPRRRAMRAAIASLLQEEAAAFGRAISQKKAMDLATIVLALSNGFGIEGLIDPPAVRGALFGEVLARLLSGPVEHLPDSDRKVRG